LTRIIVDDRLFYFTEAADEAREGWETLADSDSRKKAARRARGVRMSPADNLVFIGPKSSCEREERGLKRERTRIIVSRTLGGKRAVRKTTLIYHLGETELLSSKSDGSE